MTRLLVRVYPAARRTEFAGWFGDVPKVKVAAKPVDGNANVALTAFLARELGLRTRQVQLVGGAAARTKRFELEGISDDELVRALELRNPR
jgi:uncharacterized protein YggU (UPF0235/DUF167 family)